MRTLTSSLFSGLASPVLAKMWSEKNGLPLPHKGVLARQIFIVVSLLCALFVSNGIWIDMTIDRYRQSHTPVGIVCFVGSVLCIPVLFFAAFRCIDVKFLDIRFLRDCKKLSAFIENPGFYEQDSLKQKAEEVLVDYACEIIHSERLHGRLNEDTEQRRAQFKKAHGIMLTFGLVNVKWDRYFVEAERHCR